MHINSLTGCVYNVLVENFGLPGSNSYTMAVTLNIFPELLPPSQLKLEKATASTLGVSWLSPAPEEMVDLFQVKLFCWDVCMQTTSGIFPIVHCYADVLSLILNRPTAMTL